MHWENCILRGVVKRAEEGRAQNPGLPVGVSLEEGK